MKIGETLYLDHQATTPLDSRVFDAMRPYFEGRFGNPHAVDHVVGWRAAQAVDRAAGQLASLIGADPDEIVFTSGATEANNLALLGLGRRAAGGYRNRILLGATEHKCILELGRILRDTYGYKINYIPVDSEGRIVPNVLAEHLSDDVLLVSVMAVNNEIGTIQSMQAISDAVRQHGALLHCDGAQAPCALDLSGIAQTVDMLSLSGHKMYGPMGIGALYIQRDLHCEIEPLIYGGGQQNGLRSGTLPTPLIVGIGAAAGLSSGASATAERVAVRELSRRFEEQLKGMPCPVWINGPTNPSQRHPGNINARFEGIVAAALLGQVQPRLAASTGSACTSGIPEPSHVLRAIGLSDQEASSSIRFSLGRQTTEDDVLNAAQILKSAIENLAIDGLLEIA